MVRLDSDIFLLYIEPKKENKSIIPVDDTLTSIMEIAFSKAIAGSSNYHRPTEPVRFKPNGGFMGMHTTECGEMSSSRDYLLENGMITNSLCIFYLRYYRSSIPESEINKVIALGQYYTDK